MTRVNGAGEFVICLSNRGYETSLVVRRLYRRIKDLEATKRGLLRVVDESGEDYLFPESLFAAVDLPRTLEKKLASAT